MDIFNYYGMQFDDNLQNKLDTYLILQERSPLVNTDDDDMQQIPYQPTDQLDLEPEMRFRLKKCVTWKILQKIFNDLNSFLEPVISHLEFLVYFYLHKCEMFSRHLKCQIASIEQPVEASAITTCSSVSVTNPDKKLLQVTYIMQ